MGQAGRASQQQRQERRQAAGQYAFEHGFPPLERGVEAHAPLFTKYSIVYDESRTHPCVPTAAPIKKPPCMRHGGRQAWLPASRAKVFGRSAYLLGLAAGDRKSTRLNSSHSQISYAVFCLKK